MNEQLRIGAKTADFMPRELVTRCDAITMAVNTLNMERRTLADRLARVRDVRPMHYENERALDGVVSWITESTFTDPEHALATVADMQRDRITLPVRGLTIVHEVESVRDAVQAAWATHKATLDQALAAAEVGAKKKAEKLPVSESLREQHVRELTATERQAASVRNPCPPEWWGWNPEGLREARATLLEELRSGVAVALGV